MFIIWKREGKDIDHGIIDGVLDFHKDIMLPIDIMEDNIISSSHPLTLTLSLSHPRQLTSA
jgi:hypothetical protein